MPEDNREKRIDLFCPRCNILVAAKVMAAAHGPVRTETMAMGPEDAEYHYTLYEIALCGRCEGPFLIETVSYDYGGEFTSAMGPEVLFPVKKQPAREGVPEPIARAYDQAERSFAVGLYEPSAIMCRKCLDGLCVEFGASGHNLKEKLADLAKKRTIDARLFEWADQLRIVGNDAAHDFSAVIELDDAKDALEFVDAILMYVFALNRRFSAFVKRREMKQKGNVTDGTKPS